MSILFDCDDGWIISHLNYLHSIYETVEDDGQLVKLAFNNSFFKVNSPFLRQNQVDKYENHAPGTSTSSTVKRKRTSTLPQIILEQNDFVKKTSEKLVKAARNNNLFTDTVAQDNNEESRLASKQFYMDKIDPICDYHGRNESAKAIITTFQDHKYVFPKYCQFICNDIRQASKKIDPLGNYDLILMDPPWWNKSIRRKKAKLDGSSYKMLYNEELVHLPIKILLNPNGIVAIWCTSNNEKSVLEVLFPAWGLTFRAKWFWLKVTQNGYPICDFNERHGKQPYELILLGAAATNNNLKLPDKKIVISVPSAVHSHKPPLSEILKPYLPSNPKCIELFARYLLPGWTSWGLEVLKFQHLSLFSLAEIDKK